MIDFNYTQGRCHVFKIKTDHAIDVEVLIGMDGVPSEVLLDGYDLPAYCDALVGVLISVNGKYYNLAHVVNMAHTAYQELPDPEAIDKNEQRHESYLRDSSRFI